MLVKTHPSKAEKLRITAIVNASGTAGLIEAYCDERAVADLNLKVGTQPFQHALAADLATGICILQSDAALSETDLQTIESLADAGGPRSALIVILREASPKDVRRLFQAGISDVLTGVVSAEDLAASIDAASAKLSASLTNTSSTTGKLVVVIKAAGGVGASTLAVNLAQEFYQQSEEEVAIADLDIQFGSVGLLLDLDTRMTVTDAIRAGDRLDETLLQSVMAPHESGVSALVSGRDIAPLDVLSEDILERICRQLKSSFGLSVLELPTAWSPSFFTVFEQADAILIVADPSVRSAHGVGRLVQGLQDLSIEDPQYVLAVNKLTSDPDTKNRIRRLRSMLNGAPTFEVRQNSKVAMAACDEGKSLSDISQSADITRDTAHLASELLEILGIDVLEPDAESDPLVRRLFDKFTSLRGEA